MRKYYLFTIKKEYYNIYINNPHVLYMTLESLFHLKNSDISYGLTLYNQICNIIDVARLKNYFDYASFKKKENRYLIKSNGEVVIFDIHYPCIICLTHINMPKVFKIMTYYDKNIFVCDFENRDYFFLSNHEERFINNTYNYS